MKQLFIILCCTPLLFSTIHLPHSFEADFSQKITNTKHKVLNYSGKVYFSDTKHFKWQYLEPTQKEVCTDGVELLVVDHDLEQVSSYYIAQGLDISKILQKASEYSHNIYVALYENKKYTIQVDSKKRLQSIAYFDNLDNKVQIVFKHIKYKKSKFSSKMMQCIYPSEYDMIRG